MTSCGVYDPATNVVVVTRQRGRLLFHMGAKAKHTTGIDQSLQTLQSSGLVTQFTGQLLYPEEASWLMQRDALQVEIARASAGHKRNDAATAAAAGGGEEGSTLVPLPLPEFLSLVVQNPTCPDMECVAVFRFLKNARLHPRRHWHHASGSFVVPSVLNTNLMAAGSSPFAFDVWRRKRPSNKSSLPVDKASCSTLLLSVGAEAQEQQQQHTRAGTGCLLERSDANDLAEKSSSCSQCTVSSSLELVFRVVVCRFDDPMPSPSCLRRIKNAQVCPVSGPVPVQVAVVDREQNVLLFAVG